MSRERSPGKAGVTSITAHCACPSYADGQGTRIHRLDCPAADVNDAASEVIRRSGTSLITAALAARVARLERIEAAARAVIGALPNRHSTHPAADALYRGELESLASAIDELVEAVES